MSHHESESAIRNERNTARFFTENPSIAWVVLVATIVWGVFGYILMPKRKDPEVALRVAAVVCAWPGTSAEKIEQRITKRIESKIAENPNIDSIVSTVRTNFSFTLVSLREVPDVPREFDDLKNKLDGIKDLPENAGPITFLKDFRDTTAVMLTVASPKVTSVELALFARELQRTIKPARDGALVASNRASLVFPFPETSRTGDVQRLLTSLHAWAQGLGIADDIRTLDGSGFFGIDARVNAEEAGLLAAAQGFMQSHLAQSDLHLDVWAPLVIRDLAQIEAQLAKVAGPRYSYRELDRFTETLQKRLLAAPRVAKVSRVGIAPEVINLTYSQDRFAAYGFSPKLIGEALSARNINLPGGILETGGRNIPIAPSGEVVNEQDFGSVMLAGSPKGSPVYLRDLFEVTRDYQSPQYFINSFSTHGPNGDWQSTPAVTLSVLMRSGDQVADFGAEVDRVLTSTKATLPSDLIISKTSDQPQQVRENISLFMRSLWEAVVLVVLVSLIGFWQWRMAMIIAASIPLTLAMTFGMMHALRIDLQQVSIASLIISLGLLVDDPVVAGDAIQREYAAGKPLRIAAWLGPTKLANAIIFATITNIAAYLPFLTVHDSTGEFIYSLPVVVTCSLVASRIVSMTFIPLLGMFLLGARVDSGPGPRVAKLSSHYCKVMGWLIDHRKPTMVAAGCLLAGTGLLLSDAKLSFFPRDLSYLFYVDVWTPEDSSIANTAAVAKRVDATIEKVAREFHRTHSPRNVTVDSPLQSVTSFVGGGGPRFWLTLIPEQSQLNYAQLVVEMKDKRDTEEFVPMLQAELARTLVGARADVRQLELGEPVGVPVSIRFSGPSSATLRDVAERAKAILRKVPEAERVHDDWGNETLVVPLRIEPDRANLSGITNLEVALSTASATNGVQVTTFREGDREIPVKLRLAPGERIGIEDLQNLYVYSMSDSSKIPLQQVASAGLEMQPEKIRRRNHFRTITVAAFPVQGQLASQVLAKAKPELDVLARGLPAEYRMEIGGEDESQRKAFAQVSLAMLISVLAIYLVLVFEFRSATKPLVLFAAIPFGVVGALAALSIAREPFGFMAFLGVASLVGVIVSHVVVLFDFIEEAHREGKPLREALIDAGIVRLRPVAVTVAATVLGLVPLANNGGPLWEPLCFAQMGGLMAATMVTLILVPVIYACFVIDLHLIRWTPTISIAAVSPTAGRSGTSHISTGESHVRELSA